MQTTTKRVDLAVIGIPVKKIETVKVIFETLNESLKLEIEELKEIDLCKVSFGQKKSKLERFQNIMGKIAVDKIPTIRR